jgi:hypothetical protein
MVWLTGDIAATVGKKSRNGGERVYGTGAVKQGMGWDFERCDVAEDQGRVSLAHDIRR